MESNPHHQFIKNNGFCPDFLFEGKGISVFYTYIRKNASTSFKKLFQVLHPDVCPGELPSLRCMSKHAQVKGLTPEEIDSRFETKILVYRDPIDRVFSVYKNKLIQKDGADDLLKRVEQVLKRDPDLLTFDQFVNEYVALLETERWRDVDAHLYPQAWHLQPITYNKVIRMDKLHEEASQFLPRNLCERAFKERLNSTTDKNRSLEGSNKNWPAGSFSQEYLRAGLLPSLDQVLTPATESRLKNIYADDYVMLDELGAVGKLVVGTTDLLSISIDQICYRISLPDWETDYIQGKIAKESVPYELSMLRYMVARLGPGDLVLDIGADIGNHSLYLAAAGCTVRAFEPNPSLCNALQRSIFINGFGSSLQARTVIVSAKRRKAEFNLEDRRSFTPRSLATDDNGLNSIDTICLDDLNFDQPVKAIRIDAEGMELDVLQGALQIIERDKPGLYIKCQTEKSFTSIHDWLARQGYVYWDTFNSVPTHIFLDERTVSESQRLEHLIGQYVLKSYLVAQKIKEYRKQLESASTDFRNADRHYRGANAKYREARQQISSLQEQLQSANSKHSEAVKNYRRANAMYREACQQMAAIRSSQAYKAGLYLQAASRSIVDATKLPVRLWKLKNAGKRTFNRRLSLLQGLRYVKWRAVVPLATRLGVPYKRVAHLTLHSSMREALRLPKASVSPSTTPGAKDTPVIFTPPSPAAQEVSILGWPAPPDNGKPLVLAVMDEFSEGCFASEARLLQPRADNWYGLAQKYPPALVFIESAWKGNGGSWQYRVGTYNIKPGKELEHMAAWARQEGVPSVFWNKEDPVHHDKFMDAAALVDHIFTTDQNMVPSYKRRTGKKSVHALPFAAQPALHKPAPLAGRLEKSCFAGSWYGNRHAERGEAMKWLLETANRHGMDIFDRNHGTGMFPFPEEYQACIRGSLPYLELCKEYRRYRVFLNVNSVTDSPTMFSRRVFELMACGTPIVSTYARGIEELFECDSVWLVRSEAEADEAIDTLLNDDAEWRRRSLAGIREVFSRHTYAHRLNTILQLIGMSQRIETAPKLLLLAHAENHTSLDRLLGFAESQHYKHFELLIACSPGTKADKVPQQVQLIAPDHLNERTAQSSASAIGWMSARHAYGPHYLQDLANAMIYQPEASGWAKACGEDAFAFGTTTHLAASLWAPQTFTKHWLMTEDGAVSATDLYCTDADEFSPDAD